MENITTKICSKCKLEKELEEFYPKLMGKFGKSSECKKCFIFRVTKWRTVTEYKTKPSPKAKMRNGLMTHGQKAKTVEQQNNQCLICEIDFTDEIKPCVDHDHKTGQVRGILCAGCNTGLGFFKDNIYSLIRAIQYLSKPKGKKKK